MRGVFCKALVAAGLLAGAVLIAGAGESGGEGMTAREIDAALWASLGDVIDRGAELYNDGDIAGCYRMLEGGLVVARPLLRHRPELQKTIEEGLADARENSVMWKRAWALHRLLERVRAEIKAGGGAKKGKEDKGSEDRRPKDKGSGDKEPERTGTVRGTVSADGKPVTGGKITFRRAVGGRASGPIGPDGTYEVSGIRAGRGRVDIELSLPAARKEMALTGKVSYKGKPLTGGTIQFFPEEGRATTAPIRADGTYEVKGIPAAGGKANVQIDIRPGEAKAPEKEPEEKTPDAKGGKVVSGKVTYKKKPLAGATIVFVPAKKGSEVTATIEKDGTYEARGVPVGECRVAIRPDESAAGKLKPLARYADPKTSPLTYEVKEKDENNLDIELGD